MMNNEDHLSEIKSYMDYGSVIWSILPIQMLISP